MQSVKVKKTCLTVYVVVIRKLKSVIQDIRFHKQSLVAEIGCLLV